MYIEKVKFENRLEWRFFHQNHLRSQLQEQTAAYKEQLARVEREKEELTNYKEEEVASFKVT